MPRLTASALPRARHCAWPYRSDVSYPERPVSREADEGTDVHEMLEHYLAGDEVPIMGPRALLIFEQVLKADIKGTPEVAFAIDVETGEARVIGSRLKRNYGELKDSEIALTVDWVTGGEVGDLKTGYAGHVAHPRENLQLLTGCYAACKVARTTSGLARIVIAREDEFVPLQAVLEGQEWMDAVLAELREIHFRTRLPSPAVAGEHCSFCPALGACPQTAQATALVAGPRWTTEALSLENDQQMVLHLPMLKKAVEAIEDALKARGPIHLPNGKVWRETTKKIRTADKSLLEQLPGYQDCLREKEVSGGWRQVKA